MYQFRFGVNESDISNIFKDPEISKTFKSAFMDNYAVLLNRVRECHSFLLSDHTSSIKLCDDDLIAVFEENLKRRILYLAIEDVFSSKFNVKENILARLNASFIEKCIMDETILYVFRDAADLSEEDFENLQSKFLQK